jgi:hypothetical protein
MRGTGQHPEIECIGDTQYEGPREQRHALELRAGSSDRQVLLNNIVALARTTIVFDVPVVVSTSASKV